MNLLPQDGTLIHIEDFFSYKEAQYYFKSLKEKIMWKQDQIQLFGKTHPLPRLTSWYGDEGTDYVYSGILNRPHPWIPELLEIKKKIEENSNHQFNSLLLNRYRDGNDYVSWHADNEVSLGKNPCIASVSLGETRTFQLKHKKNKSLPTISLELKSGSLVIMKDELQDYWIHRIAPTKIVKGERINLTFRFLHF